jgi:hypothetical protein
VKRHGSISVAVAFVGGLTLFVAVRWTSLWPTLRVDEVWILVPVVLTYAAATAIGLILLRDGIARWWWVPATLFVLPDAPFESWVGATSSIATHVGGPLSSLVDLVTYLAPGAVVALGSDRRNIRLADDRIVPATVVIAASLLVAFSIGVDGPDASIAACVAVVAFGVCSQSTSLVRALIFVAVVVALGADIPGSFARAASQGDVGSTALRDGTVDIAIALLSFTIAPLAQATRRIRLRLAPHSA